MRALGRWGSRHTLLGATLGALLVVHGRGRRCFHHHPPVTTFSPAAGSPNTHAPSNLPPLSRSLSRSEHGLGGVAADGYHPAPDVAWVAGHPWMGRWPAAGYEGAALDPWSRPEFRCVRGN